ncbi:MAG TPA: hypothetical protein DDW52_00890 [Planctomycetaceae bacterium]|nr:hypothetical protein [Planctomycetaceae bacterium]
MSQPRLSIIMLKYVGIITAFLAHLTTPNVEIAAGQDIRFTDVSPDTGIDFIHSDSGAGERFIYEYVSAGMAAFDYDNDGLEDLYFLSGTSDPDASATNRLYRNLGNFTFVDVTEAAGLAEASHSLGVAVSDFNNDGHTDIFVNNLGHNQLFISQGDGTFTSSADAAINSADNLGAGVCFLDIENDGDLDIFVANYVQFDAATHPQRVLRGKSIYPSPQDFQPCPDQLLENLGDGNFRDISETSGIGQYAGTGMGALAADFDGDHDCDIFVCNDVMENFLYLNDGQGRFEEGGLLSGLALDFAGARQGSMGVDSGDVNHDGLIDLIVTSYQEETPVLYINEGDGFFTDSTPIWGGLSEATPHVTWGVSLEDFDGDRDLDLFMASGHLMDNITATDDSQSYAAQNFVYRNVGGKFESVPAEASGLQAAAVSRGSVCADLDADGDSDLVILNSRGRPTILRNETSNRTWVSIKAVGSSSNRGAVGAVISVQQNGLVQKSFCISGRSYQGDYGSTARFALAPSLDAKIRVAFPDGSQHDEVIDAQLTSIPGHLKRVVYQPDSPN